MHILNLYKPSPGLLWKCCGPSDLRSYSSGLIQISTSTAHGLVSRYLHNFPVPLCMLQKKFYKVHAITCEENRENLSS